MKSSLITLAVAVLIPSTASAGTYLGLGIGSAPEVNEEADRLESAGRSGKVLLGMRWGNFSVEGAVGRFDMARRNDRGLMLPFGDTYQASLAGKLSLPLGNNFEAFGRAGLHKSWIDAETDDLDVSGDGYLIGAGIEYRLNLAIGQGSIFVDYQYNDTKLEGDRFMFDGSSRMFTVGLTVGL
jgi:hypothetical protein